MENRIFIATRINWRQMWDRTDQPYWEEREVIGVCESLGKLKELIESKVADFYDEEFKWLDPYNYFYYKDEGSYSYGTRFSIKSAPFLPIK